MCTTAINVHKQRNINANIQSPLTEVIYRLNYFRDSFSGSFICLY